MQLMKLKSARNVSFIRIRCLLVERSNVDGRPSYRILFPRIKKELVVVSENM